MVERAFKVVFGAFVVLALLVVALIYGVYIAGARHIRPGWGPTQAVYPDAARLALWRSEGGAGPPVIRRLSPPMYVWRVIRDVQAERVRTSTDLRLLAQLSKSAWPDPLPFRYPHRKASFAAVVDASAWPTVRVLDSVLDRMYLGKVTRGLRAGARLYFGREVELLDTSQLHLLVVLSNGPHRLDPWCHPDRLRERAFRSASNWHIDASDAQLDAALGSIAPAPAGNAYSGRSP